MAARPQNDNVREQVRGVHEARFNDKEDEREEAAPALRTSGINATHGCFETPLTAPNFICDETWKQRSMAIRITRADTVKRMTNP
jgi:hypothetical protein